MPRIKKPIKSKKDTRKKVAKKKKPNIKLLKKKCWLLLKQLCLYRDQSRCTWCGNTKNLQLSHIFSRGRYPHLTFNLDNVLIHCVSCHLWHWHKDPIDAFEWLIKTIPSNILVRLKDSARNPPKEKIDYEVLYQQLLQKVQNLK